MVIIVIMMGSGCGLLSSQHHTDSSLTSLHYTILTSCRYLYTGGGVGAPRLIMEFTVEDTRKVNKQPIFVISNANINIFLIFWGALLH